MAVDLRQVGWARRLATDYAFAFDSVAPFFAGDPSRSEAWQAAVARAQAQPRARDEVATVVTAQQRRRGAPPEAVAAAERLRDPRTVAVLTGQQAGLFGGPLFTLLKAVTALKLAAQVSRDHGVPVVPIFWVEAEDHDWTEVASCSVLDAKDQPVTVTLATPPGAGDHPVAATTLDTSVEDTIQQLAAALPPTEFTGWIAEGLSKAYHSGAGMSEAFAQWLETVLGGLGLVVYDAADPSAKPLAKEIFARELAAPGQTTRLAAEAGARLSAAGYHAQVTPADGSPALFSLGAEGRRAIRGQGEHFLVGDSTKSATALLEHLDAHPEAFSPNVLLRPVVEDTLFPTICYVAGPSELAYLAQLGGVYAHFGVPMPLFYPRTTATILDSASSRFIQRYSLPLDALQPQDEAALNRLLSSQLPPSVEQSLQDADERIREAMARVAGAVPVLDPTLTGAVQSTVDRMTQDLKTLHNKIIQAAKRRDDTLRRQFMHARNQAFPGGHPQERTVSFVSFLNQYGPVLPDRLIEELPLEMGQHWVLTI